jgi:hypothetical protein
MKQTMRYYESAVTVSCSFSVWCAIYWLLEFSGFLHEIYALSSLPPIRGVRSYVLSCFQWQNYVRFFSTTCWHLVIPSISWLCMPWPSILYPSTHFYLFIHPLNNMRYQRDCNDPAKKWLESAGSNRAPTSRPIPVPEQEYLGERGNTPEKYCAVRKPLTQDIYWSRKLKPSQTCNGSKRRDSV